MAALVDLIREYNEADSGFLQLVKARDEYLQKRWKKIEPIIPVTESKPAKK